MPDEVPDSDLPDHLKAAREVPASDLPDSIPGLSPSEPLAGKPKTIGPTPATGEMRKPEGYLEQAQDFASQGAGYTAGEAIGGAAGFAVGGPLGTVAGAALGAGTAGTLEDAFIAYKNHRNHGMPMDLGQKNVVEDFLMNMGTSIAGYFGGRALTAGIPAEADTIKEAAQKSQVAKAGFEERTGEKTAKAMGGLADLKESQAADLAKTQTGAAKEEGAATEKISDAQEKLHATTEAQRQKIAKAEERLPIAQKKALGQVSPQAQIEAIQQTTGRTTDTAAKAALPELESTAEGAAIAPSAETLAKQGGPRGVYFSVKGKLSDAYGSQYEKLLGPYQNHPITDSGALTDSLDRWRGIYEQEGLTMPAPLKNLMEKAGDLSVRNVGPEEMTDWETVAAVYGSKEAKRLNEGSGAALKMQSKLARAILTKGKLQTGPPLVQEQAGATVGKLLGLKREASALMVKSTDDRVSRAAEEIADGAYDSLKNADGLPQSVQSRLAGLNSQYADYKRMFPRADVRDIAKSQTPIEVADRIFNNPTLTERVVANSNPAEIKTLQDSFGDWAQLHPNDLMTKTPADAQIKASTYGKLFPGTPFADPAAVNYVGATMDNIKGLPQSQKAFEDALVPERQKIAQMQAEMQQGQQQGQQQIGQMQQKLAQMQQANQQQLSGQQKQFANAWQQEYQKSLTQGAKAVRKLGLKSADELGGPAGKKLRQSIQHAMLSPGGDEAAAAAVTQFWTGMTPEQFVQSLAEDQSGNSMLGRLASKAGMKGSEAGKYLPKPGYGFYVKRMAADPSTWGWITALGGAQMLITGRPSWYLEIGAVGVPMLFQRVATNAFVRSLKDPELARALLSSAKGARIGWMSPLASTLMKAASDTIGSDLAKKATGISMQPDEEDEGDETP